MNSLVLTSYRPHNPASGAALRNWQNIRALASLGPVDVVSVGVEQRGEPVEGIREWVPFTFGQRSRWDRFKTRCWMLRAGVYPSIDVYHSRAVTKWLRAHGTRRRYDVAVIETISMASYLQDLKQVADRVVFDAHNSESALHASAVAARSSAGASMVRRVKDWILKRRMTAAERCVVRGADLVWACSDHDAGEIARAYGARGGVTVVPNGVDVDAYRRPGALSTGADWSRLPITLLYPGLLSYLPNEDAALRLIREVLPALRARGCQARVVLVGRSPTPTILAAAQQAVGVEVTGTVESVLPYLEQACVVTLPIRLGSGTRLKILEAFAVGRPVVSTAKGAEGLESVDGEHLLIRDDPRAIADAAIDLWNRPVLRANLCAKALELVRTRYSWSVAAQRINQNLGLEPVAPDARMFGRTDHAVP